MKNILCNNIITKKDNEKICLICLENITNNTLKTGLYCINKCKNNIHIECYNQLLEKKCLICRNLFITKNIFNYNQTHLNDYNRNNCKCINTCNLL
jgi:hypothetical protein